MYPTRLAVSRKLRESVPGYRTRRKRIYEKTKSVFFD